jgi:hypothetical protein
MPRARRRAAAKGIGAPRGHGAFRSDAAGHGETSDSGDERERNDRNLLVPKRGQSARRRYAHRAPQATADPVPEEQNSIAP